MVITKKILFIVISVLAFIGFGGVVFANNPADGGHSSISFSTTNIPADGSTSSTVTVVLKDSSDTLLNGDTVTLSTTNNASVNPGSVTLGSSGTATFTVTSSTVGTSTITVNDSGTAVSNLSGQITFYTAPTATPTTTPTPSLTPTPMNYCGDTVPGSAPKLLSAVSSSAHSITLTWKKATNPVTYYLLSFGLKAGQYQYGNPNIGDANTTSYTVTNLNTGVRYFFTMRAGNGCQPGSFSNELSAVAGVSPTSVPTATPEEDVVQDTEPTSAVPTDTPKPVVTETPTPTPAPKKGFNLSMETVITMGTVVGVLILGYILFDSWKSKRKKNNL